MHHLKKEEANDHKFVSPCVCMYVSVHALIYVYACM